MKKKCSIIIFVIFIIFIVLSIVLYTNSTDKKKTAPKKEEPVEVQKETTDIYYCYQTKDKKIEYDSITYSFSSYYKFYILNSDSVQNISGKHYIIFKMNKKNLAKFNINNYVNENQEYIFDKKTNTYTVTQDMIIEYPHEIGEFSIDEQLNYLKENSFTECEIKKEIIE